MHLGDRGGSERDLVERGVQHGDRRLEFALHDGSRFGAGEGWHLVLQQREFVGDIGRHEIAARRKYLAGLHEDRA